MLTRGINHVVLKVRNLDASDRFYRELVGLELLTRRGGMAFYSAGGHTHDFAMLEVGDAEPPAAHSTGLFHFCFNVEDETNLRELYHQLQERGVHVSSGVDHNIMHSFYTQDPDGNTVEFGVDVPKSEWREGAIWAGDRMFEIA